MSTDLQNRIVITISLLVFVQIISYVPIPLIDINYIVRSFNRGESLFGFLETL